MTGSCFLGICGNNSVRSRLVKEIFPDDGAVTDESLQPITQNLDRLSVYAAEKPQHLPQICDTLESLLTNYKRSGHLGYVNVCILAIRELLVKCSEEFAYIVEPTAINVLFQLLQSSNIQLMNKGFLFFLEYSKICNKSDLSCFMKPVIDICEKSSGTVLPRPKQSSDFHHDDIPKVNQKSRSYVE